MLTVGVALGASGDKATIAINATARLITNSATRANEEKKLCHLVVLSPRSPRQSANKRGDGDLMAAIKYARGVRLCSAQDGIVHLSPRVPQVNTNETFSLARALKILSISFSFQPNYIR